MLSRYEFTSRVRYSETGADGRMTLAAMVTRMQDCCCFHSEAIGRGPTMDRDGGWVIVSWQVLFREMPAFGTPLTTATWGYRFHGMEGDRNFVASLEDGTVCAEANARMIFFDRRLQRPVRVPQDEIELYGVEDPLTTFSYSPRRIPIPEDGREEETIHVHPRDIDTNGHVNNIAYIEMALPYLPENFSVKEMRVQYLQQARLGDVLRPLCTAKDGEFFVDLRNGEDKTCAVIQLLDR